MSDYRIVRIGAEQFDLLVPLMKDCFGMDVSIDYFRWKYLDNPAGPFVGSIAMTKADDVAAYYGAIPERYRINGNERGIYQSCDTMTHSSHRRRGLFQLLATHLYEDLRSRDELFIIGFGGKDSTPGLLKFGWKHVFDVETHLCPKVFSLLSIGDGLGGYSIERVRAPFEEVRTMIEESNRHNAIHSIKNVEAFAWRTSNPLRAYQTYCLFDRERRAVGYVTYYEHGRHVFLFDIHAKDRAAERVLFKHMRRVLRRSATQGIVSIAGPSHPLGKMLKRNRFVVNRFGRGPFHETIPFTFYAKAPELAQFNHEHLWYITPFDHDAI